MNSIRLAVAVVFALLFAIVLVVLLAGATPPVPVDPGGSHGGSP